MLGLILFLDMVLGVLGVMWIGCRVWMYLEKRKSEKEHQKNREDLLNLYYYGFNK